MLGSLSRHLQSPRDFPFRVLQQSVPNVTFSPFFLAPDGG